jgi:hypothetical protein
VGFKFFMGSIAKKLHTCLLLTKIYPITKACFALV